MQVGVTISADEVRTAIESYVAVTRPKATREEVSGLAETGEASLASRACLRRWKRAAHFEDGHARLSR